MYVKVFSEQARPVAGFTDDAKDWTMQVRYAE